MTKYKIRGRYVKGGQIVKTVFLRVHPKTGVRQLVHGRAWEGSKSEARLFMSQLISNRPFVQWELRDA